MKRPYIIFKEPKKNVIIVRGTKILTNGDKDWVREVVFPLPRVVQYIVNGRTDNTVILPEHFYILAPVLDGFKIIEFKLDEKHVYTDYYNGRIPETAYFNIEKHITYPYGEVIPEQEDENNIILVGDSRYSRRLSVRPRERAEEYTSIELQVLSKHPPLRALELRNLIDHFKSILLYGIRGIGKTFTVLTAFYSKPFLYIMYDKNTRQVKVRSPRTLGYYRRDFIWEAYSKPKTIEEFTDTIARAPESAIIVLDDVHYMIEDGYDQVAKQLIEAILESKARTVIVSDEPLTAYRNVLGDVDNRIELKLEVNMKPTLSYAKGIAELYGLKLPPIIIKLITASTPTHRILIHVMRNLAGLLRRDTDVWAKLTITQSVLQKTLFK